MLSPYDDDDGDDDDKDDKDVDAALKDKRCFLPSVVAAAAVVLASGPAAVVRNGLLCETTPQNMAVGAITEPTLF